MSSANISYLVAVAIQLGLGLAVFQANPRRKSNQCFLLLSLAMGAWLGALYFIANARSSQAAIFWIRQASVAGAFILAIFDLLRITIKKSEYRWSDIFKGAWLLTFFALPMAVFCQTSYFLAGARFSSAMGSVVAIYGPGASIYGIFFGAAGLAIVINYARDLHRATGGKRAELAFIVVGVAVTVGVTLIWYCFGFFIERARLLWLAPFRVVLFSLIIAYGIATKKIMDVGVLLRRIISYTLLAAYLLTLYGAVWWLVATALQGAYPNQAREIAHVTAAIVIAFAMAPARGVSQRLAERLFISTHRMDFRTTMSRAAQILGSVTTLDDLLKSFATTIAEAVKTDRVAILLHVRDRFDQAYALQPADSTYPAVSLSNNDPLVRHLRQHRSPIVLDELHRQRPTAELNDVIVRMRSLKLAVVMGIFARDHLSAVMFLGPRRSGRIYGSMEQNALQVLCGQLAVAIDNAELFTEVQNAKIYNETLLENLTTGVIAVGADARITVFNNEADQITGLDARAMIDRSIDILPDGLRDALYETLRDRPGPGK